MTTVPHPKIDRAIAKIGSDISYARRSRRIAAEDFAARIGVSRGTLHRLENGDPKVALSTLAMALQAIGRLDAFSQIADPSADHVTMMEMKDNAPKRVTRQRRSRSVEGEVSAKSRQSNGDEEPVYDENKFVGF